MEIQNLSRQQYRACSDFTGVYAGLALYWLEWSNLNFGSSRVRVSLFLCVDILP
jgi:hypothetical protein